MISPKTAQNIFVRKALQVGTLLKYRSHLTLPKIFVTRFFREPDPQGHLADENDDGEFLQLGNGHACHPERKFSFLIMFS